MVVIVCTGLPATGKSTIAKRLKENYQSTKYISSDQVRRSLFSHMFEQDQQQLIYDETHKEIIYNAIQQHIEFSLTTIDYVIVDATYHKEIRRKQVIQLCRRHITPLIFLQFTAPEEIIRQRLVQRDQNTISDARWEQFKQIKQEWENWGDNSNLVTVETDKSIVETVNECIYIIKEYICGER